MKKILIAIDGLSKGGAERVTAWLANNLDTRSDYKVSLLVNFHQDNEYFVNNNVEIYYINDNIINNNILKKINYIDHVIKMGKFDLVISLGMPQLNCYVTLCCCRNKVRFILSERNDPKRYPSNKILRLSRWVNFSFANKLVFQTTGAKDYFRRIGSQKGVIIDNPLTETLPEPYFGKRDKFIVNFCRLTSQKNLKLLIDAFEIVIKTHKEYKLFIYGEGELEEELKEYIKLKRLDNKIVMNPFAKNVHEIILKASAFVSSSDYEGVSNSMLEALAIGLPCICTDCPPGGSRQFIISGENGILVPVRDRTALAKAICQVLNDEKLQNKLSMNGVKIRQRLKPERIYNEWKKLIQELI